MSKRSHSQLFPLKPGFIKPSHRPNKAMFIPNPLSLYFFFFTFFLLSSFVLLFFLLSLSQEDKAALSEAEGRAGLDMAKGNEAVPCLAPLWDKITANQTLM